MSDAKPEITLQDVMETMIHHHEISNKRFDQMDAKFEGRFAILEKRFDDMDVRFDQLEEKVDKAWEAHSEDIAALNNDILEIKKFVGMPLPALD